MNIKSKLKNGFTLIELLVVVAIISMLIVIVTVAIDAPRRFADANDTRRLADIRNILNSIHEYTIDNKGTLPSGISTIEQQLGNSVAGCVNLGRGCNTLQNSCLDMSDKLKDYLKVFPFDPKTGNSAKTNYTVSIDSKNIVTVKACGAEGINELFISM